MHSLRKTVHNGQHNSVSFQWRERAQYQSPLLCGTMDGEGWQVVAVLLLLCVRLGADRAGRDKGTSVFTHGEPPELLLYEIQGKIESGVSCEFRQMGTLENL